MMVIFTIQLYFIKITNEMSSEINEVIVRLKIIDENINNVNDLWCRNINSQDMGFGDGLKRGDPMKIDS